MPSMITNRLNVQMMNLIFLMVHEVLSEVNNQLGFQIFLHRHFEKSNFVLHWFFALCMPIDHKESAAVGPE